MLESKPKPYAKKEHFVSTATVGSLIPFEERYSSTAFLQSVHSYSS